ncbi:MAG: hypothetical protein HY711_09690 [Candidatus Melainabacteria bacterium]|nr:hypothetical protein [Candidatus Melainabacteria bacterium]
MIDNDKTNTCDDMRLLVDRRLEESEAALTADQCEELKQHLSACASCRTWEQEMSEIMAMAASAPQFDVSEALTQRILSAVRGQTAFPVSTRQVVLVVLAVASMMSILVMDSVESIAGLGSWLISLAGMAVFKQLLVRPDVCEQRIRP